MAAAKAAAATRSSSVRAPGVNQTHVAQMLASAYAAARGAPHAALSVADATGDGGGGGGGGGGASKWLDACGVPHRHSEWAARAALRGRAPLVYVYDFLEPLHAELLAAPSSRTFFDPWHQHNQFLSEVAFHRSLLASALVTNDPDRADFFFVPFYARIAYAEMRASAAPERSLQARMLAALRAGLKDSRHWRRSRGRDHIYVVSSTRPMEALFGASLSLVAQSILLKIELGDRRRKSDVRQPNHVALPYYVPWLARDEGARREGKRFSVCLDASTHGGAVGKRRAQLIRAFRDYPRAMVRASDPQRLTRSLLCASRRRLRQCKFCLVPRGLTPSSRRLYEALAAKCVPVVLSDRFVLPFEGSAQAGGGGLLPPRALDTFMLRLPESTPAEDVPRAIDRADANYDAMLRALLAYRTAYLYELPLDGQPSAGGAVCAAVAEIARRFAPHLNEWRGGRENRTGARG